jgi:hypothetical protein
VNMQEKFGAAIHEIADERELDLVIERDYANTGHYSFQPRGGFEPVLRFPFNFQTGYSSFNAGGRPGPLGCSPKGGPWSYVEGGEHEQVLARVVAVLDGEPDTDRIVVLPDGETYGPLIGSKVCEVPSDRDCRQVEVALVEGSLRERELR